MSSSPKYTTLKFRTYNSRDRQGFVLLFNTLPPQLILQDILFQLFFPLFPSIIAPQIYYLTQSQQLLSYSQLLSLSTHSFIYLHFLQRNINLNCQSLTKPFFLVDLQLLAQGLDKRYKEVLYIFSQKSYIAYKNKKYCEIVKNRIDQYGKGSVQKKLANVAFIGRIKEWMGKEDIGEIIRKSLVEEGRRLEEREREMGELMRVLLRVKGEVEESLGLVKVNLKSVFDQ